MAQSTRSMLVGLQAERAESCIHSSHALSRLCSLSGSASEAAAAAAYETPWYRFFRSMAAGVPVSFLLFDHRLPENLMRSERAKLRTIRPALFQSAVLHQAKVKFNL